MHFAKIQIWNRRDRPHVCYVEPCGDDFTLLSNEGLEIQAWELTGPPWFYLSEGEDSTSINLENCDCHAFEVSQNGVRLESGHRLGDG